MKKYLLSIGLGSMLVLAACGDDSSEPSDTDLIDEADASEEDDDTVDDDEVDDDEDDLEDDEQVNNEESDDAPATEGGHVVGETVSDENGEQTLVSLNEDIDTIESGPIVLEIEKVNGVSAVFEGMAADMLDDPEVEYIQVDMVVENTSDDDVTFYASQAKLITDTGEQLDPDMWFSDHLDGDYFGNVTKSGSSIYILENSMAEDVTSVELRYSAPFDTDSWDDLGEDIKIEIDL
ncbi:DUF4352 domain-containing protein [Geomicrobium sp. JCM 19039]|uniref:DUF4352 domain-containing protein n=1 Tax=Geomicrobium sp. JCM 19039 TaxID=1460636 RepID=UPI00045F1115|nr:DUF4352 domain-containing protein [Geomicrobium sp. JCM 19039]GAK12205.1 hypothetical protein JCM19039_1951 [Geomicrobium sp. JCM 19039]